MSQPRPLILIVGTSGSGKSTIIGMLKQRHPEFLYPLSLTTRDPRPDEVDGVTYHFVSKEEFERAIEAGELLEWAVNHEREYYGILKGPVIAALDAGQTVVREISIAGIKSIKETELASRSFTIFLMPPSMDLMRARILKRSQLTEEEVQRRLKSALAEIEQASICDLQILAEENQQEKIYAQVEQAIRDAAM